MNRRRHAHVQMILDGLFPGLFEVEREPSVQNHLQLYMDLVEECASAEEATEDAD